MTHIDLRKGEASSITWSLAFEGTILPPDTVSVSFALCKLPSIRSPSSPQSAVSDTTKPTLSSSLRVRFFELTFSTSTTPSRTLLTLTASRAISHIASFKSHPTTLTAPSLAARMLKNPVPHPTSNTVFLPSATARPIASWNPLFLCSSLSIRKCQRSTMLEHKLSLLSSASSESGEILRSFSHVLMEDRSAPDLYWTVARAARGSGSSGKRETARVRRGSRSRGGRDVDSNEEESRRSVMNSS
mmetsp:Transcript_43632/g.106384  ORF Transcript_43632/g.106384 Transcript_43632/m.106384 type:complete len:244 (-) Transcript_43632:196-927(-)